MKTPDKKTAIIAMRETWQGELHNIGPDENSDGPKIGERGPYTLDVTYTLTKNDDGTWSISDISVNGTPPAWTNSVQ